MALPYKHAGTFIRSAGLYAALAKQTKLINLKSTKRLHFTFDPFEENAIPIRDAVAYFHLEKVQDTNPNCLLKTSIICNRAEPTINITLETGYKLLFKTKNLQTIEILELFNKFVSSKVVIEEETAPEEVKVTKAKKTKAKKAKA